MGNAHPSYLKYPLVSTIILDSKKMTELYYGWEKEEKTLRLLREIASLMEILSLTVQVYTKYGIYVYCSQLNTPAVVVELRLDNNNFVLIYKGNHIDLGTYHNHLENGDLLEKIRPGITKMFDKLLIKHGVKAYGEETRHLNTGNNCFLIAVVIGILLETPSEMDFLNQKIEGFSLTENKNANKAQCPNKLKERQKKCTVCTFLNPVKVKNCQMCTMHLASFNLEIFPPSPKTLPPPPPQEKKMYKMYI